jgi:hypothetical protein
LRDLKPGGGDRIARESVNFFYTGNDAQSSFRNFPQVESQAMEQMNAELEFSGRLEGLSKSATGGTTATGVLPVHIRVPTGGQVYRFARTVIRPGDPLSFSVAYTRLWVISLFKWFGAALAVLVVWWNRHRLVRNVRAAARFAGKRMQMRAAPKQPAGEPGATS